MLQTELLLTGKEMRKTMAKYIYTTKTAYNLDSDTAIEIKGDVNNLNWFTKYNYDVYIGSGGTEFKIASGKNAADFSGGFTIAIEISGENNFARISSPKGQSCYIRAAGTAGDKTVEYRTYITLKAPKLSMPAGFKVALSAVNENDSAAGFGNCAVIGFSKLKAELSGIQLAYSSWITRISFSSPLFNDIVYASSSANSTLTTQAQTSAIVDRSGLFTLRCTVTNNFGYSVSSEASIYISGYGVPKLSFTVEPHRTVDVNGTALDRKDKDKNRKYGFRMELTVTPHTITGTDGKETTVNKIVAYDSENSRKAYITLINDSTGAVAFLQSSSEENAVISDEGVLTTYYLSGSTADTVSYPEFDDDSTGLTIYNAYLLKILVKDITGKTFMLTKRIPSMTTTLHLRKGGRGLKVGGYSDEEEEDLFSSDWKFKCNESIEAVADDTATEFGEKGTVKGKFVEASAQFKLNKVTVEGIGEGADKLAKGDHSHGPIKYDGTTDTENAVIISDSTKNIKAVANLPTNNLTIEKDTTKMQPCAGFTISTTETETHQIPGSNQTVTTGKLIHKTPTAGSSGNAVRADHTHPYSREWMNDPVYIETIKALSTALSDYL